MNTKHKFQNKEGSKELYTEISDYITQLVQDNLVTIVYDKCNKYFQEQYNNMISEIISDTNHCWDNKLQHIKNMIAIYVVQKAIQTTVEENVNYDNNWLSRNYNEYAVVHWENTQPGVIELITDRLIYANPSFLRNILIKLP